MKKDIIDMDDVMERVQDDRELLMELLDIFQNDYMTKRELFEQYLADRDAGQLRDLAHSLKGAAGNISATQMFATCRDIEKMANDNIFEGMEELFKTLDKQFKDLQACIAELKQS
jgi:HPt (histidine-containing phosphotransfer) domain-containing protein